MIRQSGAETIFLAMDGKASRGTRRNSDWPEGADLFRNYIITYTLQPLIDEDLQENKSMSKNPQIEIEL